jgi:hypothetical protein
MLIPLRHESLNPGKRKLVATEPAEYPTVTNTKFAEVDKVFQAACSEAGLEPTPRQASKYRNKRGLAYGYRPQALATIRQEEAS